MAQTHKYSNVHFTSIVLDECGGARNIIETPDEAPRWNNVHHYYMEKEYKEHAKEILGFRQVPFYVVLNEQGEIVQKGSKKQVDFETIPGIVRPVEESPNLDREEGNKIDNVQNSIQMDRVFCMDDDF